MSKPTIKKSVLYSKDVMA